MKKKKQLQIFKNEKYKKDLIFLYLIYAYLDMGLREENWVTLNKFGVNVINDIKLKEYSEKTQQDIKKIYSTTKRIFKYLMQENIFNGNGLKESLVVNNAKIEIKKAFSSYKDYFIIPIYLGILLLISWQEDVKYKVFKMSLDYKHLANISLNLEEEHKDLEKELDKSAKIASNFYINTYGNYNWCKKSNKIDLKSLFNKKD